LLEEKRATNIELKKESITSLQPAQLNKPKEFDHMTANDLIQKNFSKFGEDLSAMPHVSRNERPIKNSKVPQII
jgi:hypothetical protein